MYTNIVLKTMKNGGTKMNSKIIKRSVESHFNSKIDEKTRKREIVYKNKYRIKLLQNKKLYNYTKECISKLEQMEYKYSDVLRKKLNDIINDKKYVTKQN